MIKLAALIVLILFFVGLTVAHGNDPATAARLIWHTMLSGFDALRGLFTSAKRHVKAARTLEHNLKAHHV